MVDEKSPEMKKQKISLEDKKWARIDFNDNEIKVYPYISLSNKINLIKSYIESFFSDGDFYISYIQAEYSLILEVVDLCTDLDITDLKIDGIINSALWEKIKASIKNYDDFRKDLDTVVRIMREDLAIKKSVGSAIDKFSEKAFSLIDKFSELDLSNENVGKLIESLNEISVKENFVSVEKTPKKKKAEIKEE